jgi:PIN domain nuclease of toxin-antitoxin system
MRVLIDSHVLIWALMEDPRLSRKARSILTSSEHELFFSMASLWEVSLKIRTGKLRTITSSIAYLRDELVSFDISILPIVYDDILAIEHLEPHHKDPFDRMLIAQAMRHGLSLLTYDEDVHKYPLETIW